MNKDNRHFFIRGDVLNKYNCSVSDDGKAIMFPFDDIDGEVVYKKYTKEAGVVNPRSFVESIFGWEQAIKSGGKKVIVVSDEYSVLAMQTILNKHTSDQYKATMPAIISVKPEDAGRSIKEIKETFKEVVFAYSNNYDYTNITKYDSDIKVAKLPSDSIEESRLGGADRALFNNIMFNSSKPTHNCVKSLAEFVEEALQPVQYGKPYPWPTVTKMTYGQRKGELIAIGAGTGTGKCQGYNTPILMYSGDIKMVQDVKEGELLMGDDSTPRQVVSLARGKEEMFKVVPNKGETYTFNRSHILAIKISGNRDVIDSTGKKHKAGHKSTITINDYIASSDKFKHVAKLYKAAIEYKEIDVDSYSFGLNLKDGDIISREYIVNSKAKRLEMLRGLGNRVFSGDTLEQIKNIKASCGLLNAEVSFTVESIGEGDYYGFSITGNRLYVLGDYTVTHNTLTAHELTSYNATNNNWKTLMFMLEETNRETLQNLAGKVDSITYHKPGTIFDKGQFIETATTLNEYVTLWDNTESFGSPEEQWKAMREAVIQQHEDLDVVIFDNMTVLAEGLDSSVKNDFIAKVASEMADLALKYDLQIVVYSHLNQPAKGSKSHENGGQVLESQFTGSRALQRYAHMMIGFERNKSAVDPNCSLIRVLKNRKYGRTGIAKTYYNLNTGRLLEKNWDDNLYKDNKIGGDKK